MPGMHVSKPGFTRGSRANSPRRWGACAIIRGVRNTTDFEYERTMEATNHRIYPDITTVMLFTPAPVADISSSTVREVLSFGRSVEEFMPVGVDINKYL